MKKSKLATLILTVSGLALFGGAYAQDGSKLACERTRAEVRSECVDFLQKHRWDEVGGDYVLKSTGKPVAGLVPPEGVKTRQQIRADRDAYLRAYRWNDATSSWEPLGKAPREVSKLSRADMRKETMAFLKTHEWDDAQGGYVDRRKN